MGGGFLTGPDVGDPRARVIYGTRRLPLQPMVYFGIVSTTVNANGEQLVFTSKKEFPVTEGDTVYIGNNPSASKQPHIVLAVDYGFLSFTIEAHDVLQLTEDTVVIGMARDEVYNTVLAADKIALEITAVSIACREADGVGTEIDEAICVNRMQALEEALAASNSASHMRISPDTVYGLRDLTEEESNTPNIINYEPHSGKVTIGVDTFRGGGNGGTGTDNDVISSDLMQHIGASAAHEKQHTLYEEENNRNLSPSNYFLIDVPETTGIYEAKIFNSFLNAHYKEDWFVWFGRMQRYDGVNNLGLFQPNYLDNPDFPQDIQYNDELIIDPYIIGRHGFPYKFKICGLANTKAYSAYPEPTSTHTNQKMVCFIGDRSQYPGDYEGPNGTFLPARQFFRAEAELHDGTIVYPILGKLMVESGSEHSDGVQAIFKGNTTLDITDNTTGVNLAFRTNDYMISEHSGQVDVAFPYKSISLTSNDLMAVPERSGDANQLQPILSSYSIPTMFDAGTSTSGKISSFTSSPYGTITFSEGGARRYHNLSSIPGGLRQFTVRCILDPKDDTKPKSPMKLPPGGRFSLQLVFVRKG